MTTQPKLTKRETGGYSMGALGGGLAFNLVRSYFVVFCMTILGVSAGFLMVMFFVLRLWDAISDPIVGLLSENIKTPWGKHKPWVAVGAVLNAAVIVVMFSPWMVHLQSPLVAVVVVYILFGLSYTVIDVPYYAYAASFVDEKERDIISTWPRLIGGIAMVGIPVLTRPAILRFGESEAQGYFYWTLLLMGAYVVFAMIAAKSMKKREVGRREKTFSFKEALQALKNNDQLLIIEVVFILVTTAVSITQMVALFYFVHVWDAPQVFELFMVVAGAGMGIAMASYPFLARKISRRKIFLIACIVPLAGYVVMFLIATFGNNPFWMLPTVLTTVGGFGFFGILTSIFMVDTVEYGEWKLGYRSENLIFSLLTLIGKFSGALATLIFLGALHFAGYVETRDGMFAGADAIAQTVQPATVNVALNILMFAVPPVILGLALWLYLKKYKLHGNFLAQITQELAEKRSEVNT